MKKELHIRLSSEHKSKLVSDSLKYGFPSMTAYLEKLIEIGMPVSESLDKRLQLIEKKIDTALRDINKRGYVTFRTAAFILARTYFIKNGHPEESNIKTANEFVEKQLNDFQDMSGE